MDVIYQSETTSPEYESTVVSLGADTFSDAPDLQYPCIVLEGVEYVWELNFLKNRVFREHLALPVYVNHTGHYFYLTQMELTEKTLALFNSISEGSYKVSIHKDKTTISEIDYTDGETLEKFIRLG